VGLEGVTRERATAASTVIQTVSQYLRPKQQQENESCEALAINLRERERPAGKCKAKSEASKYWQ